MPSRRAQRPEVGAPTVDPATGIELLSDLVQKGESLLDGTQGDLTYDQWKLLVRNYLERAFGENNQNVYDVVNYGATTIWTGEETSEEIRQMAADRIKGQVSRLRGLIELLHTYAKLEGGAVGTPTSQDFGTTVFLVHGHNEGAASTVARFIEQLGAKVVILHERPNKGRTIIEKFEEEAADIGFAVALLTPDDRGGLIDTSYDEQHQRARQNVIFELGFFLGRLGRPRVCALYVDGVEIPSDYQGVLFVPLDDEGTWRLRLAKELRAAGLPVDMNRA